MNPQIDLRAVLFDMDGVLIDSHPAHRAAWREFLCSLGKDVSDTELSFILDGRTRAQILRHFLGELSEQGLQTYGKHKDELFRSMEQRNCLRMAKTGAMFRVGNIVFQILFP